jgi:penicillin-binding protein 1A
MTDLLRRVIKKGTLSYPTSSGTVFTYMDQDGKSYTIPAAGKTGTTQNWADAWTLGYTPYMTTAIWFGFDRPGNSLGVSQSGAAIAGIAWANYMAEIHRGLPAKDFVRPHTGLIDVSICSVSGLLPTEYCDEGTETLTFYEGTQPRQYCDLHEFKSEQTETAIRQLSAQQDIISGGRIDSSLDFDPSDIDALLRSLETRMKTPDGGKVPAAGTSEILD